MGGRRAGSRLAAAGREEDHLLAGPERSLTGAREGAAVPEVLAVDADHAGVLVRCERLDELGRLDVGLVPERREARDADAVLGAEQAQLEREVAALGDDPERAGLELVHAEIERGGCVVDAEAVRAEHHRAGAAHLLDDAALELLAAVVDLAETGGDRDDPACSGSECVVDALLERRHRDRDHDELGRAGQLGERAERLLPEDLAAVPVDEPDVAAVGTLERAGGDPLAPLRRVVRRAEHGERAWIEERAEITHGCKGTPPALTVWSGADRPSSGEAGASPPRAAQRGSREPSPASGSREACRKQMRGDAAIRLPIAASLTRARGPCDSRPAAACRQRAPPCAGGSTPASPRRTRPRG